MWKKRGGESLTSWKCQVMRTNWDPFNLERFLPVCDLRWYKSHITHQRDDLFIGEQREMNEDYINLIHKDISACLVISLSVCLNCKHTWTWCFRAVSPSYLIPPKMSLRRRNIFYPLILWDKIPYFCSKWYFEEVVVMLSCKFCIRTKLLF